MEWTPSVTLDHLHCRSLPHRPHDYFLDVYAPIILQRVCFAQREELVSKRLWPWDEGSWCDRLYGGADQDRPLGPGHAFIRRGCVLPHQSPVPAGCCAGGGEGSSWLRFRQVEWTSLGKYKRGNEQLRWSHRKKGDHICLWLKAEWESWNGGRGEVTRLWKV